MASNKLMVTACSAIGRTPQMLYDELMVRRLHPKEN